MCKPHHFPNIFLDYTGDMERLHVNEFCNLFKLTNVSTKKQNWTLLNGLNATQCEHELAFQCIAELQARLAPLERQVVKL